MRPGHHDLTTPPPLEPGVLRIVALGGIGEIGRNMAVLEIDGRFTDVRPRVTKGLEDVLAHGGTDAYALEQGVRRQVGRWVSSTHRRRPMIVPVVVEV